MPPFLASWVGSPAELLLLGTILLQLARLQGTLRHLDARVTTLEKRALAALQLASSVRK